MRSPDVSIIYPGPAQNQPSGTPFPCGGWSETSYLWKGLSTKLQNRHFHTSRTRWGCGCETSFISLYHQDLQCQAEIPCWYRNCLLVWQNQNRDTALPDEEDEESEEENKNPAEVYACIHSQRWSSAISARPTRQTGIVRVVCSKTPLDCEVSCLISANFTVPRSAVAARRAPRCHAAFLFFYSCEWKMWPLRFCTLELQVCDECTQRWALCEDLVGTMAAKTWPLKAARLSNLLLHTLQYRAPVNPPELVWLSVDWISSSQVTLSMLKHLEYEGITKSLKDNTQMKCTTMVHPGSSIRVPSLTHQEQHFQTFPIVYIYFSILSSSHRLLPLHINQHTQLQTRPKVDLKVIIIP